MSDTYLSLAGTAEDSTDRSGVEGHDGKLWDPVMGLENAELRLWEEEGTPGSIFKL